MINDNRPALPLDFVITKSKPNHGLWLALELVVSPYSAHNRALDTKRTYACVPYFGPRQNPSQQA